MGHGSWVMGRSWVMGPTLIIIVERAVRRLCGTFFAPSRECRMVELSSDYYIRTGQGIGDRGGHYFDGKKVRVPPLYSAKKKFHNRQSAHIGTTLKISKAPPIL